MDPITFNATLPQIQTAISMGGDATRVNLDIPPTDIAEAVKLAAYAPNKRLKVTVMILDDDEA